MKKMPNRPFGTVQTEIAMIVKIRLSLRKSAHLRAQWNKEMV